MDIRPVVILCGLTFLPIGFALGWSYGLRRMRIKINPMMKAAFDRAERKYAEDRAAFARQIMDYTSRGKPIVFDAKLPNGVTIATEERIVCGIMEHEKLPKELFDGGELRVHYQGGFRE